MSGNTMLAGRSPIRCGRCRMEAADAVLGLCGACFATTVSEAATASDSQDGLGPGTILLRFDDEQSGGFWELRPGTKLDGGRFTLEKKLGAGGMGDVWLGTDHKLRGQGVALKFLNERLLQSQPARERLKDEVLHTRRLRHPNIVAVHDWHEPAGDPPFFSMEYVPGANLAQLIRHPARGVFSWEELAPLTQQWLDALIYAHEQANIIHRDLKPANLLLGADGRLRVADFGIAQPLSASAEQAGRRSGTWAFASPQQFIGEPPILADDIYAVGSTLFELLTGEPPIDPHDPGFEAKLRYEKPDTINARRKRLKFPKLPARFAYVSNAIAACLEKDPAARPNARDLQRWLAGIGAGPDPAEISSTTGWFGEAFKLLLTGVLLVVSLGFADWIYRDERSILARMFRRHPKPPGPNVVVSVTTNGTWVGPSTITNGPPIPSRPTTTSLATHFNLIQPPQGTLAYEIYSGSNLDRSNTTSGDFVLDLEPGPCEIRIGPAQGHRARDWISVHRTLELPGPHVDLDFRKSAVFFRLNCELSVGTRPQAYRSNLWGRVELSVGDGGGSGGSVRDALVSVPTRYVFEYPRHHPAVVDVIPVAGGQLEAEVTLEPFTTPQRGHAWTNSQGTLMQPMGDFWCAPTETTVAQFAEFAAARQLAEQPMLSVTAAGRTNLGKTWRRPWTAEEGMSRDLGADPVVGVSWSEAMEFCAWLTATDQTGGKLSSDQAYLLPSRAQWRQLSGGAAYPWGSDSTLVRPGNLFRGNFAGLEVTKGPWATHWFEGWHCLGAPEGRSAFAPPELAGYDDGYARTAPVGKFARPNDRLFDVAGNAAEWGLEANPDRPGERIVWGGSWFDDQLEDLKVESVRWYPATLRDDRIGFRVVVVETVRP